MDKNKTEEALSMLAEKYGIDNQLYIKFVNNILSEGNSDFLEKTHDHVSMEQFLEDDFFLGGMKSEIWDEAKKSLMEIIGSGKQEVLLTGATGTAKTTRANILSAYDLYILSCYRNIKQKLNMMDNSELVIVMLNKTDFKAKTVTYKKFKRLIE